MCLAVPGRVLETFDQAGLRMGRVAFGEITRNACLESVPEAQVGDYVLVHVGFALSVVDEEEAHRTLDLLREMGELAELGPPASEGGGT